MKHHANKLLTLLISCLLITTISTYGQAKLVFKDIKLIKNKKIYEVDTTKSKIKYDEVFTTYKHHFKLGLYNSFAFLKAKKTTSISKNDSIYFYQQFYKNYEVDNTISTIHTQNELVSKICLTYVNDITLNLKNVISSNLAFETGLMALKNEGLNLFEWKSYTDKLADHLHKIHIVKTKNAYYLAHQFRFPYKNKAGEYKARIIRVNALTHAITFNKEVHTFN